MSVPPIIVDKLTIKNLLVDDMQFTLTSRPVLVLILILTIFLLTTMIAHFSMLTYNSCKRYENQRNQRNQTNQTNLLNPNQRDEYNFSRL